MEEGGWESGGGSDSRPWEGGEESSCCLFQRPVSRAEIHIGSPTLGGRHLCPRGEPSLLCLSARREDGMRKLTPLLERWKKAYSLLLLYKLKGSTKKKKIPKKLTLYTGCRAEIKRKASHLEENRRNLAKSERKLLKTLKTGRGLLYLKALRRKLRKLRRNRREYSPTALNSLWIEGNSVYLVALLVSEEMALSESDEEKLESMKMKTLLRKKKKKWS